MRDGWHGAALGDLVDFIIGRTPPRNDPSFWTQDLARPFCTIADMATEPLEPSREGVTEKAESEGKARRVPAGSLLLSYKLTIGRVGFAACDLFPNEAIAWLRPKSDAFLDRYLALYLGEQELSEYAGRAVKGNTLTRGALEAIPIVLPPLAEQRRIVGLMAAVDDAHSQARAAAEAAHRSSVALREAAFDNPTRPQIELQVLCERDGIQIGPFGSQLHASDYVDEGIPSVMPQDIVQGRINDVEIRRVGNADWKRLSRHHLREGDIVLPRRGDLTKRALVEPHQEGWLCGTGSVRVRVSGVSPRVVFEALSVRVVDQWLAENAVGITMPNLNTAIVSSIPVRLPANADAVLAELTTLGDYRSAAVQLGEHLATVRSALLAELLSGAHEIPESYDRFLESA